MKARKKIIIFIILSLALIACDRITKNMAKAYLMNKPDITFLHNTIVFEYVENTGAALSLGDNLPQPLSFWLLSMLPLAVMLALLWYTIKNIASLDNLKFAAFLLVFAGGCGNIIDRLLFDRHVTDFLNIGIGSIRTGIFNFADMCVTAGAIAMVLMLTQKDHSNQEPPAASNTPANPNQTLL